MIYREILQSDFDRLPPILRRLHTTRGRSHATGAVFVRHIRPMLARLFAFPRAGQATVDLEVDADERREVWTRCFGRVTRRTVQCFDRGLLRESVGPLRIWFRLRADETGMRFEFERARLCGIPFPVRVEGASRGVAGDAMSWEFEVTMAGVASYRGVMELDQ